ncbi:MAG: MBL fold metallo-hydrolase [Acidobacteriota bacterium]
MHTRPRAAGKLLLAVCSFVVMSAAPAARSGWAHAAAADDAARPGRFERLTERAFAWVASDERSSNGALFIGDREALAVDPGLTPSIVRGFLRATRRITDRPIRTVVLTHWHPDHAMGVVCLTERTFTVLAHPQTRRSLAQRAARLFRRMADRAEGRDDPFAGRECEVDLPSISAVTGSRSSTPARLTLVAT